jgi:hypothetical protein
MGTTARALIMADDFTRRKFVWLDQVVADRGVSSPAFRLAYILASHLNRGTGLAFPSQATLSKLLFVGSTRWVRRLVDQLVERGHLAVTAAGGEARHSNFYRPIIKDPEPAASPAGDTGDDIEPEAGAGTLFPEIDEATNSAEAALSDAAIAETFEDWWLQYPRRVGKGHARRAYEKIVRSGRATSDDLITGVMRYAAERDAEIGAGRSEPKFTKHPATWLNAECWQDETAPRIAAGQQARHQTNRTVGTMSAIEGIADWLDGGGLGEEHE